MADKLIVNDNLVKLCTQLVRSVLEFKVPTDALLSKFFRDNRKISTTQRGVIAETAYVLLRNYNKITSVIDIKHTYSIIAYVWLHWLHITKDDLILLKTVNANLITGIPAPDQSIIELPDWIVKRLKSYLPENEIHSLSKAMEQQAPLTLRANTLKMSVNEILKSLSEMGIAATATKYSPYGITLVNKLDLIKNRLFLEGAIEVQDEASQLAGMLLMPKRSDMVVDFCAGSGGKTLLFGMLMKNSGRIYAFDINERRLGNLSPRLARSGLSNVYPQLIESENDNRVKRLHGKIDCVFVDAPCLGLGTLRRNPDLKFRYNEESLKQINEQQLSILTAASKLLKPGGRLVYATCSILQEENQDIVNQFLLNENGFSLMDLTDYYDIETLELTDKKFLSLNPARHGTDGFFAALLVKNL